jgi:hypothetical protein
MCEGKKERRKSTKKCNWIVSFYSEKEKDEG